jgi:dihydrofolate synthase/folylpolyglutamate synthase
VTAPLERLLGLARWERAGMRLGLDRIEAFLTALGRPEAGPPHRPHRRHQRKGSVAALTAAILQAAGLRTGLYTSPHLLRVTERVRIDGRALPEEVLARHAARIEPALEAGAATFFEAMTAVALAPSRRPGSRRRARGGARRPLRRDQRRTSLVSVVTRIDYDHQEFLGQRLADIAGEKAGIIRGGTALSAAQAPEAMTVIETRCRDVGVPLLVEGRELRVETLASDLTGHRVRLRGRGGPTTTSGSPCRGCSSRPTPCWPSARSARSRRRRASGHGGRRAGRLRAGQVAGTLPDRPRRRRSAHARPRRRPQSRRRHRAGRLAPPPLRGAALALVLGISADKDRAGILKPLAPLATRIYLAPADHPRATPPKELVDALPPIEAAVALAASLEEALERALGEPGIDVVCVAGSLFLVADALRWLGARGLVDAV